MDTNEDDIRVPLLADGSSQFPVARIFGNVSAILQKTKIALAENPSLNPKPKIVLEDKQGKMYSDLAKIDTHRKAHLSVAYAQYLWIFSELVYKTHDSIAINSLIHTEEDVKAMMHIARLSKEFRELVLPQILNPVNADYIEEKIALMKDVRYEWLDQKLLNRLKALDMDTPIGVRINSICAYGLVFALCHEASHSTCGHNLNEAGTEKDEWEADNNAFWTMVSNLGDEEQFSAMVGVISVLVSFFFLDPTLSPDPTGVHPREPVRLMTHFDNILKICPSDKKNKYVNFLVVSLCLWSGTFDIKDFSIKYNPFDNTENLEWIREYFKKFFSTTTTE